MSQISVRYKYVEMEGFKVLASAERSKNVKV